MPYTNYTLAQLRGLLDNQLGSAATVFWRTEEKNNYINEGLRVWNCLTGYWKQNNVALGSGSPKLTVADQVYYSLPGTITSGMRVRFNGTPLYLTSLDQLDDAQPNWESESGDTVQMWAPVGLNQIAIWPADHSGGNSLWADGVATTPVLVDDADKVDIGSDELNGLLDYCQHVAMFKEGGEEFKSSGDQFQQFLKSAAETNSMLSTSAKFRGWMGIDLARESNPRSTQATERAGAR